MTKTTPQQPRVVILDDEVVTVRRLVHALKRDGYETEGFVDAGEAMARLAQAPPEVLVMDVHLKDADGVDLMQRLQGLIPTTAIILITGYASIDHAVEATKKGAFHYLAKPFRLEALRTAIADAVNHAQQLRRPSALDRQVMEAHRFGDIIGEAPAMRAIFKTIAQVAPVDCNILIRGESGTGKELVAHSLHQNSTRAAAPFVPFNCGAFAEDLVANELFGHEKGAFTGAASTRKGLLESANGGTVFLDEIGEMPLSMQVKLLRVLQERTFLRVGGIKAIDLDVRFIAATNQDMEKMITTGAFRQDLYFRLKVVMIDLPPLRKRREDIPALIAHFATQAARQFGKPHPEIAADFREALIDYPFPGNVRELQHLVERAVVLSQDGILRVADLPPDLTLAEAKPVPPDETARPLKSLEKDHIFEVYRQTGFNQSETARLLGISRTTLWRRLHEFDLLPQRQYPANK
ncbi:MAG: sigma-54 dependent transcriptional regulator [Desulfobulbaceae bacterium]|nr:sigma-54 dependent transcriptional regulator [Desulfobulbaceae bacterium]